MVQLCTLSRTTSYCLVTSSQRGVHNSLVWSSATSSRWSLWCVDVGHKVLSHITLLCQLGHWNVKIITGGHIYVYRSGRIRTIHMGYMGWGLVLSHNTTFQTALGMTHWGLCVDYIPTNSVAVWTGLSGKAKREDFRRDLRENFKLDWRTLTWHNCWL